MNRILTLSLVALTVAAMAATSAQQGAVPLQRGVHVEQPVTPNAAAVPNQDQPDALVVAVTADGAVYHRADPISTTALSDQVRSILSTRTDRTLYIKADARVPYARLVEVIDAVQKSGVEGLTLLTAQQEAADKGKRLVPPKGLEMRVVSQRQ